MKKVLLINGSPHKAGCTFTALQEIAQQLKKNDIANEIVHIGDGPHYGCLGCGVCRKTGHCFREDIVCQLQEKMRTCDGMIVGSPVHYASAAGALCTVLDRLFYSASASFDGKPAAAIVSCRRGGASAAFDRLNKYFTICNMPVVSSRYWNSVHGNTPEEVRQDTEGLQVMRTLADNMAWMLHNLSSPTPVRGAAQKTNFIR